MTNDRRRRGDPGWEEEERYRRAGPEYRPGRYGHGYGSEFDERGSDWGRSGPERDWGRRREFGQGREYGQDYGRQFEERGYGGGYGREAGTHGHGGGWHGQPEGGRGFEQAYGAGRERSRSWMHEGQGHPSWQGQGAYAGRGPKGYTRSDDRIKEDVCDRLTDDPQVDASNVEVSVSNGEVTLGGTIEAARPGAGPKIAPRVSLVSATSRTTCGFSSTAWKRAEPSAQLKPAPGRPERPDENAAPDGERVTAIPPRLRREPLADKNVRRRSATRT